jgi:methyl-accepting chemotaxis protein
MRKLAGLADLEDALKRLDRLTQEEARMAHTEVLRITHNIRQEVKIVDGKVERVDNKVDGVGDRVDEVGDKVDDIGDQVRCVDGKVQVAIDGARGLFGRS